MNKKRFFLILIMIALATSLFAAGDDFGFNEYIGKVKTFLTAIGGGLLLVSLGTWAIKAIITKNISPEDKKAIIVMAVGGILLIVGSTIVSTVFSGLGTI